ncbi:MAG: leucine zipper domain-containing protein [Candidatus Odinarchaeota archaeon]
MRCTPEQRFRWKMVMMSFNTSVRKATCYYSVRKSLVYKFLSKYRQEGMKGLISRSRTPKNPHRKVTSWMEEKIVDVKPRLPEWGSRRTRILVEFPGIYLTYEKCQYIA